MERLPGGQFGQTDERQALASHNTRAIHSRMAEKEREHASGEVRLEAQHQQHTAVQRGMQKEVDRLEEALRWAKNVADASVEREQRALARLQVSFAI